MISWASCRRPARPYLLKSLFFAFPLPKHPRLSASRLCERSSSQSPRRASPQRSGAMQTRSRSIQLFEYACKLGSSLNSKQTRNQKLKKRLVGRNWRRPLGESLKKLRLGGSKRQGSKETTTKRFWTLGLKESTISIRNRLLL